MVIQVYITSARRSYEIADHYRALGSYVVLGGLHVTSLPDEAAAARRHHLPRAGRGHLAGVPAPTWRAAAWPRPRYVSTNRTPGGAAADPARPDPAPPLPGAQLDRGFARLPAPLRLLLQGRVLRGRQVVLHADRRRRAGRDRPAARPAPLLPRRPPVRQPALRRGAVRRDARAAPAVAGGRHGRRRARARPAGAGGRGRAAQPLRRLRDGQRRQPRRAAQAAERRARLRRRGAPAARPRA